MEDVTLVLQVDMEEPVILAQFRIRLLAFTGQAHILSPRIIMLMEVECQLTLIQPGIHSREQLCLIWYGIKVFVVCRQAGVVILEKYPLVLHRLVLEFQVSHTMLWFHFWINGDLSGAVLLQTVSQVNYGVRFVAPLFFCSKGGVTWQQLYVNI